MTFVADLIFIAGALALLTGLGLVDYRLSMVVGGALAMLYAWKLSEALSAARRTADDDPDDRRGR